MFEQLLAVTRNTFFESIRQPIMLVLLVAATLLIIISNPLSAFTMDDDQRMLIDIGLATVFIFGALIAAFISTSVLTREIENRTALTVVSKPLGRPIFIIGKYLGVACALALGTAYMGFVFLLTERHGVLQTVRDPIHAPVVTFGVGAAIIGVSVGIWVNYFYNKVFASAVICTTTPLLAIAYFVSLMFSHDFSTQSMALGFNGQIWLALAALMVALLILAAVAIAASTRLSQAMTLVITLGVFLLGMLSDWFFGRRLGGIRETWLNRAEAQGLVNAEVVSREIVTNTGETIPFEETIRTATVPLMQMAEGSEAVFYAALKVAYTIVPNFQVLLLSDALTQGHRIPVDYVLRSSLYGVCIITAMIALAIALFQNREVG